MESHELPDLGLAWSLLPTTLINLSVEVPFMPSHAAVVTLSRSNRKGAVVRREKQVLRLAWIYRETQTRVGKILCELLRFDFSPAFATIKRFQKLGSGY